MTANNQIAEASIKYLAEAAGQAVPVGYKQTEVGVIPVDWVLVSLGDVCGFENGDRSSNYPSPNSFVEFGIPFINAGHVANGVISLQEMNYIKREAYDRLGGGKIRARDILFCLRGSLGKYGVVSESFGEGAIASSLVIVRPKAGLVSLRYLANCYMASALCQKMIELWAGGAAQPNLGAREMAKFLLPLPPKNEQTAIANALSDVDALINELEKLIAKKQAIKTATMQQLLTGRTRLPQFALHEDGTKKGYKQSELGEIPEDWECVPFGNVMSIRHGRSQKSVETTYGKFPIFATGGQIGSASTYLYDKPSVLIGRKGTIDRPRFADTPFWTVDTLFYSEIKQHADAKFIFYQFYMIDWMQYNEASGVPSLNASTIESVLTRLPTRKEQTAIATILSDMDADIQTLQQRLNKTRQIKQGMMQELLTGRIRLVS